MLDYIVGHHHLCFGHFVHNTSLILLYIKTVFTEKPKITFSFKKEGTTVILLKISTYITIS